ncbi:MAG: S8 family serine peptidase, partial [Candidatus Zixiibacteriota bacterium]
ASVALLFVILLLAVKTGEAVVVNGQNQTQDWWYAPGVLVVEFDAGLSKADFITGSVGVKSGHAAVDNLFKTYKINSLDRMFEQSAKSLQRGDKDLSGFYRITFDSANDLDKVAEALASLPEVESVEKVGVHPIDAIPNDASFNSLWGLNQGNDRDIDAPEAWNIETGDSAILVGAMDTGVQWNHADLGGPSPYTNGNIWINWAEYNGASSVDDDGNGYIDDFRGWDWVDVLGAWSGEDADTPDNDPMDFNGHGTHTSGTMAGITNNGIGVAGVAGGWSPADGGCRIVPLRIGWSQANAQGNEAGYVRMDFAAQAFNYATQIGVTAVNCSWGSSNSGGIQAAVDNAVANGMVICTSAGNSNNTSVSYLAGRSDVISVASVTSSGTKSSFSNYGSWVDVSAPGSNIYSTYSNHGSATYASLSGTSMASPHVAGLAGLIRSKSPGLTATQVRDLITNTTDDIDAQNTGYIGLLGTGRINANTALLGIVSAEAAADVQLGAAPLAVSFSGSSLSLVNSWLWRFGDGDSAFGQNVMHVYNDPGSFDVSLQIDGSGGQATQNLPGFIVAYADTITIGNYSGAVPQKISFDVSLKNFAPISSMQLPLTFGGNMDLALDSISVVGARGTAFESINVVSNLPASDLLTLQLTANNGGGSPPLPAGDGVLFRMYFGYTAFPPLAGLNLVDTASYSTYRFAAVTPVGSFVPVLVPGTLSVTGGIRGDANVDGIINISDPVYLINYIFSSGLQPPQLYDGDADANAIINISDAVYLIAYIFAGGPPPPF